MTTTSENSGTEPPDQAIPSGCCAYRRGLLQLGAATALALLSSGANAESDDPKRTLRPQAGDVFARYEGDTVGGVINAADLKVGDPPVVAWPMDPATKLPRDGSRLNQVVLLRLDPASLGPRTQPHAADGMVAYSAICTHAQCTVTGWIQDRQVLHCPCHQSQYDPRQDAAVVGGPAPRPLAALPLKVSDGKPTVASGFVGRVGMNPQTM